MTGSFPMKERLRAFSVILASMLASPGCVLVPHYVEVYVERGGIDVDGQAVGPEGRYVIDSEDPWHVVGLRAGYYLRPVPVTTRR